MLEDYRNALRAGQRATRAAQARGQSPYLAVLDDILRGVNICLLYTSDAADEL